MKKIIAALLLPCIITSIATAQIVQTSISKKTANALSGVGLSRNFPDIPGRLTVRFAPYQPAKNDIKTISTPLNSALCLTKEEVKGQKVENEQIIADGSRAEGIVPGGVIDAEVLLASGRLKYIKADKRKPVTLSTPSNLVKKSIATVTPSGTLDFIARLTDARQSLTVSANMRNPDVIPNVGSVSNLTVSTIEEKTSIDIGASAFYMGVYVEDNFKFSSEKYRYMYLYTFEQRCITVMANDIAAAADVFTDVSGESSNWMYIPEVAYGRRLYVIFESQYDLERYSNELN